VQLLEYIHSPEVSGVFVSDDRDATIAALTTDRDVLRLEVQRLKDLNFEAQDLYAAIEAERDELRAEVERLKETRDELRERLDRREKQLEHASIDRPLLLAELELAERQRDEAVSHCEIMAAEVRRLTEERDEAELLAWKSGMRSVPPANEEAAATYRNPYDPEVMRRRLADLEGKHGWQWYEQKLAAAEKEIFHMREPNGRADDYSAKLERVIEALRYELAGVVHCHAATIRSIVRLANAGLELPEVTDNA